MIQQNYTYLSSFFLGNSHGGGGGSTNLPIANSPSVLPASAAVGASSAVGPQGPGRPVAGGVNGPVNQPRAAGGSTRKDIHIETRTNMK